MMYSDQWFARTWQHAQVMRSNAAVARCSPEARHSTASWSSLDVRCQRHFNNAVLPRELQLDATVGSNMLHEERDPYPLELSLALLV